MRTILILFCFALVSGCKSYTSLVGYVQKNCEVKKESHNGNTFIYYSCGSLYDASKVKEKCQEISITFDAASAKISGRAVCNDSLIDIERLIKLAINRK